MTVHEERCLDAEARSVWVKILGKVAGFCGVTVVTYSVMENHFHLLVRVPAREEREKLSDAELVRRFRLLYGDGRTRFMPIGPEALEALLAADGQDAVRWRKELKGRMHDLPMFMKLLKQRFSKWYNASRQAKGTLWADRYTSTLLEPSGAILRQVACFIDLNAVRLGAVAHPEDYVWCGFAAARMGDRAQAAVLAGVMPHRDTLPKQAFVRYEAMLYQRGGLTPKRMRRDAVAEFLLDGIKLPGNPLYSNPMPMGLEPLAMLAGAIVYGGYVFVEAQAKWVAKALGRKQPGSCYQLGEGEWTLNRRLKKKS
jgi:putative transposase